LVEKIGTYLFRRLSEATAEVPKTSISIFQLDVAPDGEEHSRNPDKITLVERTPRNRYWTGSCLVAEEVR
jgi:hypothetical protein